MNVSILYGCDESRIHKPRVEAQMKKIRNGGRGLSHKTHKKLYIVIVICTQAFARSI